MNNEQRIEEELKRYQNLAKQDKRIDVAGLMMEALEKQNNRNLLPHTQKRWGYIVSLVMPPFGLLFAAKFYFSNTEDGQEAAFICIALAAASVLLSVILFKLSLSGSGLDINQLELLDEL